MCNFIKICVYIYLYIIHYIFQFPDIFIISLHLDHLQIVFSNLFGNLSIVQSPNNILCIRYNLK